MGLGLVRSSRVLEKNMDCLRETYGLVCEQAPVVRVFARSLLRWSYVNNYHFELVYIFTTSIVTTGEAVLSIMVSALLPSLNPMISKSQYIKLIVFSSDTSMFRRPENCYDRFCILKMYNI